MFDKFGNDSSRYNIDNFEFIAKTSPKVAELMSAKETTLSSSHQKTTVLKQF